MNPPSNFSRLIRAAAEEEGIRLTAFSDDWAFLLEKDGKRRMIVSHVFPLNRASSAEVCKDKALCYDILHAAGIPAVLHQFIPNELSPAYVFEVPAKERILSAMGEFPRIVLKDNYGSGGSSVRYVDSEESLDEALDLLLPRTQALALSPYLPVREEYRIVMLDGSARLSFRKQRAAVTGDGKTPLSALIEKSGKKADFAAFGAPDPERVPEMGEKILLNWKHNLGQGAVAVPLTDPELLKKTEALAKKAQEALDIRFASVDLVDDGKKLYVLEVNAGVMMEHFAGQSESCFAAAKEIYRDAVRLSFDT